MMSWTKCRDQKVPTDPPAELASMTIAKVTTKTATQNHHDQVIRVAMETYQ